MKKLFKNLVYRIEYIIFILLVKFLRLFSISNAATLVAYVARSIGPLLPVSNLARKNIKYSEIEKNDSKVENVIINCWDNIGRFIGEFAHLGQLSDEELTDIIQMNNPDILEKLCRNNTPFILFTGHFANWDLALSLMSKLGKEISVVYRKANNPFVDKFIRNTRMRTNITLIEKGPSGFKSLITCLRAGKPIVMLVDQKNNQGMNVPFMGKPSMSADAIARIALQFNYKIIPAQVVRIGKDSKFEATIQPELEIVRTGDEKKDIVEILTKINNIIEQWVKQNPSQWFWFHDRWGIK